MSAPKGSIQEGMDAVHTVEGKGGALLVLSKASGRHPYVSIPRGEGCRGGDKECQRQMGSHF